MTDLYQVWLTEAEIDALTGGSKPGWAKAWTSGEKKLRAALNAGPTTPEETEWVEVARLKWRFGKGKPND